MMGDEETDREAARLEALRRYRILDTPPEQEYEDATMLASQVCAAPISLVSLVDESRQWFKSRVGLGVAETPREISFCAYAIRQPEELFVVGDATHDDRFAANPLVTGEPHIRFYAGAPLVTPDGEALGTICVIDRRPRELSDAQRGSLVALGRQVVRLLELRRLVEELRGTEAEREEYRRQLEVAFARAEAESVTDALTGLRNRRALETKMAEEYERARRYGVPLSLLLLDVDRFKDYNDAFGHPAGDEALAAFARLLGSRARAADFVARYGGEEFAVVLPSTGAAGARVMAERFRRAVEAAEWPRRPLTVSVGVATHAPHMPGARSLLDAADAALYRAKQAGRNRVEQAGEAGQ